MGRAGAGLIGTMLLAAFACATPAAAQAPERDRCFFGYMRDVTPDQIIDACTRILESADTSRADRSAAFRHRGDAHRRKQNDARALADFDRAIEIEPTSTLALVSRADLYMRKGDHDRAFADYTRAVRLEPGSPILFAIRGQAYAHKGAYDHAIADYDEAIRLNPQQWDFYDDRGVVYMHKGDHARAIVDFNFAIRLEPEFATRALGNRCLAFAILDGKKADLADCDRALQLDKDDLEVRTKRGFARLKLGDEAAAIADYDAVLASHPRYADALFGRGIARLKKGDRAGGDADIRAALSIDPRIADRYARLGFRAGP